MDLILETLERRMVDACVASIDPSNPCVAAVKHHFAAGGTRVRARICLEASLRLGLDEADALCLAASCELLHNASLIQDDLLDHTVARRGNASVWVGFGDTVAVCAGDLMMATAYASLISLSTPRLIPATIALVHERARDAIFGQALESVRLDQARHTFEDYERLAVGKSASLLSLALELPLLVSGQQSALAGARATAAVFSVAYQISDDLEDVEQDAREGSMNIVLLLQEEKAYTLPQARCAAAARATALLDSAICQALQLPSDCAAMLIVHAEKLHRRLAESEALHPAPVGV